MIIIDANLSPRLKVGLRKYFPGCVHVSDLRLSQADDMDIFRYAKQNNYHILSKDSDFEKLVLQYGSPPKLLWIKLGNCRTTEIAQVLENKRHEITAFLEHPQFSVLYITP